MPAEDFVADGMEGAAPKALGAVGQEVGNALQHFARGLVGEGQQENVGRLDPVFEQVGDAIGQRARLAAARAGDDEHRPRAGSDGLTLLRVEFGLIVDAPAGGGDGRGAVELVGASHDGFSKMPRPRIAFKDSSGGVAYLYHQ